MLTSLPQIKIGDNIYHSPENVLGSDDVKADSPGEQTLAIVSHRLKLSSALQINLSTDDIRECCLVIKAHLGVGVGVGRAR